MADSSWNEFVFRHVLDSIQVLKFNILSDNDKVIDIGSGAGFPGLPIRIINDTIQLLSIESNGKKCRFQKELIEYLDLTNAEVINERIESVGRTEIRSTADVVVTRALADISVLLEYSLPLLKNGGLAVYYKGSLPESETEEAKKALQVLGGEISIIEKYRVRDDLPERSLVVVEKIAETPEKYPRRVGIPQKRPIK